MINKKDFKKVVLPELVKFCETMKEVTGKFVSMERSQKYSDSMGLIFNDGGEVNKMVFVNSVAQKLISSQKLKAGDEFLLVYVGMKKNKDETQEYMDFEMFVKE